MDGSTKRPHSPSGEGGNVKKPKGPGGGGYYGGMGGGPPGWGGPYDDYGTDDYSHRDEWYPVYPPPPPPPPPPPSEPEDFADDSYAIYGTVRGRGGNDGNRGRGPGRGGYGPRRWPYRGRGGGYQNFRGYRGGQAPRGAGRGGPPGYRGRGRGQFQKGMPPNAFGARGTKKGQGEQKETVPPVHSLAKVGLDVSNMSVAEKIHRFSLFVRNDPMKENAIQHIMNAQSASKLMIKVEYESEELAKVGSKHMYTGRLSLSGVFLARGVCVSKKELKHLVFEKALNVLMTKTVAEIYSLIDPGVETLREELEREEEKAEKEKNDTPPRDWMGQDFGEALQIIIHKLKTKTPTIDSDISRIEQAISVCNCVLKHQFIVDTVKLRNGRVMYKGGFEINNVVIGRGKGASKKICKRETYGNAMKNLMEKSIEELLISVPEEEDEEIVEMEDEKEEKKAKNESKAAAKKLDRANMTVMERFSEVLKALKAQPYKESNVNPIDVTALAYGLVPMSVYRKLDTKGEDGDSVTCDLYLDNIFIASADGKKRNPAQREAYNKAWELLTTTDAETILTQHPVIDADGLKANDVLDFQIKGGGKKTESNIAALRRNNRVEQSKSLKKEDLVIVEHADWSNDRIRNAFCILQCSCSQNGMLLKWTTEGSNSRYVCEIFIQDEKVGEAVSSTKQRVRHVAMQRVLCKLYETQDTVRISRRDDSKSWIPYQKILEKAERLRKESQEEEVEMETNEGVSHPDKFVVQIVNRKLEDFAETGDFEEVIIGPGMPAAESREVRNKARMLKLLVDVRQHLGESYLIFYKKLDYMDLVKLLKKRKRPYGKYELVPKEDLPKYTDIEGADKNKEEDRDKLAGTNELKDMTVVDEA